MNEKFTGISLKVMNQKMNRFCDKNAIFRSTCTQFMEANKTIRHIIIYWQSKIKVIWTVKFMDCMTLYIIYVNNLI